MLEHLLLAPLYLIAAIIALYLSLAVGAIILQIAVLLLLLVFVFLYLFLCFAVIVGLGIVAIAWGLFNWFAELADGAANWTQKQMTRIKGWYHGLYR